MIVYNVLKVYVTMVQNYSVFGFRLQYQRYLILIAQKIQNLVYSVYGTETEDYQAAL
jgi:hypothetical protein